MAQVRLSVSVPAPLARWTRDRARERGQTISAVVSEALRLDRRARLEREMVEGLVEDAATEAVR